MSNINKSIPDAKQSAKAAELTKLIEEMTYAITDNENQANFLQTQLTNMELPSLIGTEVKSNEYGTGTVVAQEGTKVTVQFSDVSKSYIINRKYGQLPIFDTKSGVLDMFSAYDDIQSSIKCLKDHQEAYKSLTERADSILQPNYQSNPATVSE